MPLSVDYQFEETDDRILIRVFLKRVKKAAIDVYIADAFVKVNCSPYLWSCDLRNFIDPLASRYGIEEDCTVRIALVKATPGLVWHELRYKGPDAEQRRDEAAQRAVALYNEKLTARSDQRAKEEKRFFAEHWELEKQQRADIERRVAEEKREIDQNLQEWEESLVDKESVAAAVPSPPAPLVDGGAADSAEAARCRPDAGSPAAAAAADESDIFPEATTLAAVRSLETTTVNIDFTPSSAIYMPQRSRSDEEHYRRSRYKPESMKDTPFHFKEKGDMQCRKKDWKGASDSYSEALKRDTCFLAALQNRAVCWLMLHDYRRAAEDGTLALNMLQSTPAANTTGDRFRHGMMKTYARRSAALCWAGEYEAGMKDMEMAVGYSQGEPAESRAALMADLAAIKAKMQGLGMLTEFELSPLAVKKAEADRLVTAREYERAYALYTEVLQERPDYWDALANRSVVLLCLRRFKEVVADSDRIIQQCQAVAGALADGGVGEMSSALADSDDEDDDGEGEESGKRKASNLIKSSTTHVYALLKAFLRKGSACAGLKDYRGAYEHYELALRIMPYDNDLRDDVEAFRQKLQLNNVIAAATDKKETMQ
eukprot:Rhum_TRINITY_DN14618_c11_g1::Rhum_TRINITY_DN14618_c11_g1_i1::g.105977::m.105977/K19758/DYX1C1, DNAAF4; dyslexia susceptibility 1 candidate gene 1 protein